MGLRFRPRFVFRKRSIEAEIFLPVYFKNFVWRIARQIIKDQGALSVLHHPAVMKPLVRQIIQHIVDIPDDREHHPIQYVTNVFRFAFAMIAGSV